MNKAHSFSDEFFLQCISNYKPLYDKADKGYKSLLQKENCWASVAKSLCCTAAEAKTRFKSLREKYRRELQAIEKLEISGAPASARPVWPLMSFFKFMYKCGEESQRQTSSNFSFEDSQSQGQVIDQLSVNVSDEENIILEIEEESAFSSTCNSNNIPSNEPIPKKRKVKPTERTNNVTATAELKHIDNVLVDVSAAINNFNARKSENSLEHLDRYELFSKYLASELRNISEPHSSILMEELQLVIINYKRDLRSANDPID